MSCSSTLVPVLSWLRSGLYLCAGSPDYFGEGGRVWSQKNPQEPVLPFPQYPTNQGNTLEDYT